jgi:thienamycin biosynthesis protein ThnN
MGVTKHTDANTDASKVNEQIVELLELHFHQTFGAKYWLGEQHRLQLDVLDRVRRLDDLKLLGTREPREFSGCSVWDLIPSDQHKHRHKFLVGETAGTTGTPTATAYTYDEFNAAFIEPFLRVAESVSFPRGVEWLFVGPSGPHLIGKAARELAKCMGSPDPWTVDFDPRWAKKLVRGSLASRRYLAHVIDQALSVLRREAVTVIFSTPPVLNEIAETLTDDARENVLGLHYGGISISAEELNSLREQFPNAVHLSGYGNTLFGCAMETNDGRRTHLDYFPTGDRLRFDVVLPTDPALKLEARRGQLMFHRFDRSVFMPNVLERDWVELVPASPEVAQLGFGAVGIRDPAPPRFLEDQIKIGIY